MDESTEVVRVDKEGAKLPSFVRSRLAASDRERMAIAGWDKPGGGDDAVAQERVGTPVQPPPRPATFRFKRSSAPPGGEVVQEARTTTSEEDGSPPLQRRTSTPSVERRGEGGDEESRVAKVARVVSVDSSADSLESFPVVEGEGVPRLPQGPSEETLRLVRDRLRSRHEAAAQARGLVPGEGAQPGRAEGTMVSRAAMEQYLRRGETLFNRWRLETGAAPESEEDADPVAFVNWLLSRKPTLKASSWKLYRLSTIHYLDGFPSRDTGRAIGLLETDSIEGSRPGRARERWEESRRLGRALNSAGDAEGHEVDEEDDDDEEAGSGRRTSALKEKRFPEEMLEKVRMRLRLGTRSRLAEAVADWLEAGILTGLRPVEWGAVELVVREVARSQAHPHGRMALLYVINAKATNGRGTGVSRTLDLSTFGDDALGTVRRHSVRCRQWLEKGTFGQMKAQCSALLQGMVRALWPNADGTGIQEGRHYALYSCRHQAIANWKSLGMPLEELAALVGHGVTSTATERYGKRRSGWRRPSIPEPPRGVPEEVSLVRTRINMFQERVRLERELGIPRRGPAEFPV